MGNYNSQYESYYSRFTGNKKNYSPYSGYAYKSSSSSKSTGGNYFTRRVFRELIGVLCLFFVVLICKSVVTPQTTLVYNYSKNIVNKNFDITYITNMMKSLNITDLKSFDQKMQDMIESLKLKITGGQSIQEKINDNFIPPTDGEITSNYGEKGDGIEIEVAKGSTIKAVFDGNIKQCSEDGTLGNYILINHGSGVESRYGNLGEILVSEDAEVKKGDVIGKALSSNNEAKSQLYFELLYMGQSKNPLEYINFGIK